MKLREYFKAFFHNVKDGISRYIIAFLCSVLFYLTVAYNIIFEVSADDIIVPLCMTFALTGLFSVLLKTVQEYLSDKLKFLIQSILCAVVAIAGFLVLRIHYESLYATMAYSGIMIAFICFIFFILMRGENCDTAFPKLVASSIFTAAVCGVLSAGLSTCIAAFQSLIFNWSDSYKIYFLVNLLVWIVGYPNVFLSAIPKNDIPVSQSKIFRVFVLFAGLPLYLLLLAILLVYLAKIVVTLHMPVGEINWFASFASLFFIFFVMSVMQYSEKLAKWFIKYGGYFLIPILIMQAIAVFERISAYGLTTPRTVSLVLILISILFIGGTIIAPKHLNKLALASGIIVLAVTVTPFNVIDMPVASQTAILKDVLTKNNMLENGVVVPNPDVSKEDAKRIESAYHYLKYNAEKTPDFITDSDKAFSEIFGFPLYQNESNYSHCFFRSKNLVDISNYTTLQKISSDGEVISFEHNGQQYVLEEIELAQELYNQFGKGDHELEPYKVDENVSLYITSFSVDLEDDIVYSCYFNGYALIKN